ncbi:MAG: hydrogenase maturation protease [Candidatus Kryptonium sp.]
MIVGIGNVFRGDDSIGILIARFLRRYCFADSVKIIGFDLSFDDLIEIWDDFGIVILIDAIESADKAGTIYRFEPTSEVLPAEVRFFSTHTLGLAEYIQLGKAIKALPVKLIIYGIVGKNFWIGAPISNEVKSSCRKVIQRILEELGAR